MNTIKIIKHWFWVLVAAVTFTSCLNDLDTIPLDEKVTTSATVYDSISSYKRVLAKCYAGLATTGQQGPAGIPDVGGIDEGFSSYLRGYWNLQELTTDEAVTGWGDDGLQDLHSHLWTSNNDFVKGFYYRVFYQIAITNEFIRQSADSKLDERGVGESDKTDIRLYRAEARFLRALSYWHALDLFGSVPFVTEDDGVGAFLPKQISKTDLFNYIEQELLEIESLMAAPRTNEYGRADQAAAWMLLAKLYLNAEVYIGTAKYTEAATYAKKVIDVGYEMDQTYQNLFLADNHTAKGIIFPITFDGVRTKTWGGTTFIINGAIGGSMVPANYGVKENWGGHRTTRALVEKFEQYAPNNKSVAIQYKSVKNYPVLNCPGGYQGWDPASNATVLYSRGNDNTFEGYLYFAEATEFKFAKGGWDQNWGVDSPGTLKPDGGNIPIAEVGLYKVNVDLNNLTYSVSKTEWGIIGNATAGGWDNSTAMTYDTTNKTWTVEAKLNTGEFKFRANNAWDINLGLGTGAGILKQDGGNIAINEAGKYLITLKLQEPDYQFTIEKASSDERAIFYTNGQSLEIDLIADFTNGYAVPKFKNITSTGQPGSDNVHADTDFPLFRIEDAYLIYAEAALRGGGDLGMALEYVNRIRTRGYTSDSGKISAGQLTLDFIIDERARELYWEAHRRTDLIRFGLLTSNAYIWPWKGGIKEGKASDAKYNLFPIPASDIIANPNLQQNSGY